METVVHPDGTKEEIKMIADPSPAPSSTSVSSSSSFSSLSSVADSSSVSAPVVVKDGTKEDISSLCRHFEEIALLLEAITTIVNAEGADVIKPTADDIKVLLAPYQNINEHVQQLFSLYNLIGPKKEKKSKKKADSEAEESDGSDEDDAKDKKKKKSGQLTMRPTLGAHLAHDQRAIC